MAAIVEVDNLAKQYDPPDGVWAVKGLSFTIEQGEIFSLLGPNGAGKTTTLSMLSGLLLPTGGNAWVAGRSVVDEPLQVKEKIGVIPQEIALYDELSARENLVFWGKMYGLRGERLRRRVEVVLEIAGLGERGGDKVATFSGGMKRRINIAVGLLHEPQILYMDEPTVGIDPQSRRRILDTIKELNERGLTVLYTTHYMEEAQELSDRIGIIDHGELRALGTLEELTRLVGKYDVIELSLITEDEAAFLDALAALPGVARADGTQGEYLLQVEDARAVLPHLVAWSTSNGGRLQGLEIHEPNLEAVFLHLTGRALRD